MSPKGVEHITFIDARKVRAKREPINVAERR